MKIFLIVLSVKILMVMTSLRRKSVVYVKKETTSTNTRQNASVRKTNITRHIPTYSIMISAVSL